jgi:acyl CoA:acetate/3-ketoacid CoA transferase alpha subunit
VPDKVAGLADVVRSIPDGAHIALGGFATARNPIAFVHELIRRQKTGLTLSQCVMGMDTDLLVGAGLVRGLVIGGGSLDRFGPVRCVNRARESGAVRSIDSTSLAVCFGYLAGALGLSFMPIKSMLASEMLHKLEREAPEYLRRGTCPFTGEEYVFLRALTPDVSVIHVQVADREGNCRIHGPRWENEEQAKAARRVIVTTEALVSTDEIRREPERTVIPGHRVEAVVHLPFGAHPTSVFGCYDYDADHLRMYAEHTKTVETTEAYLRTYVRGTRDHAEYLEQVGGARKLNLLKADPVLGY